MGKSVVFLSDGLKVKLGYGVSRGSTRNQSLRLFFFFIKYCLKCRVQLNPEEPWWGWDRTGDFPPGGACPASSRLYSLLLFSDWWRCWLVPAVVWCYGKLSRENQTETKLPSSNNDYFTEPIHSCKGGVCETSPLTRHSWVLIFLCGFPLNTAFLFGFCQGKKPDVSPPGKLIKCQLFGEFSWGNNSGKCLVSPSPCCCLHH